MHPVAEGPWVMVAEGQRESVPEVKEPVPGMRVNIKINHNFGQRRDIFHSMIHSLVKKE